MTGGSPFSRRDMLRAGGTVSALAAGATLLPIRAQGAAEMKGGQVPGYYRFRHGAFEITVLSDGAYTLPTNLLGSNVAQEKVVAFLEENLLDPDERISHVNIPLINTGKELILIDVGGGMNWMPTAGKLTDNLRASGYEPEDVDMVVLTHGHPDHIWGLIDDFEEAPSFPNAKYVISADEWDFWTTSRAMDTLPEMFLGFAVGAKKQLGPVAEKTRRIKPGAEISPGIVAIPTPGHTPGHMSVAIESEGETLLVTADALTHPFISFAHPGWWPRTDIDPEMAEKSRRAMMEMAADGKHLTLVYHISFPGLGRVARAGTAYRWVPSTWQWGG